MTIESATVALPGIDEAARYLQSRDVAERRAWDDLTIGEREVYRERACTMAMLLTAARDALPTLGAGSPEQRLDGPLRRWFTADPVRAAQGHAVIPRTLAQSMPLPWQERMADLLDELDAAFRHIAPPEWEARAVRWIAPTHCGGGDLDAARVEVVDEDGVRVFLRDGDRLDRHARGVLVRIDDTVRWWPGRYIAPIERGDR